MIVPRQVSAKTNATNSDRNRFIAFTSIE
jgi:hypothetical protein